MEKKLEFTCRLTPKDILDMNRCATAFRMNLMNGILIAAVLIYTVINGIALHQAFGYVALTVGVTAIALLILTVLVRLGSNYLMARKIRRIFGGIETYDVTYTMNSKFLKYSQAGDKNVFKWEDIRYVKEMKNIYVVRATKTDVAAFSKRDMPEEEFRELLERAVPARKRKLRKKHD